MKLFAVIKTGAATKSVAMWIESNSQYEFIIKDISPSKASKVAAFLNADSSVTHEIFRLRAVQLAQELAQ